MRHYTLTLTDEGYGGLTVTVKFAHGNGKVSMIAQGDDAGYAVLNAEDLHAAVLAAAEMAWYEVDPLA